MTTTAKRIPGIMVLTIVLMMVIGIGFLLMPAPAYAASGFQVTGGKAGGTYDALRAAITKINDDNTVGASYRGD